LSIDRKHMRFSIVLAGDRISNMTGQARLAEDAGFEAVWTIESPNRTGFVPLAAAASNTERIKLGTGIAFIFGRVPQMTAAAAMDIDELSGGRMILGLGTGTRRMNEDWYGLTFEHPARRVKEYVALLRSLWTGANDHKVNFDGRYYRARIDRYGRRPRPRDTIPVYIAAVNPVMLRLVGEIGDGLMGHPLYNRKYLREQVLPEIARGASRSARHPSEIDVASYVITSIHPDPRQAWREAKAQIAFYATTRTYSSILKLGGFSEAGPAIRDAFERSDVEGMIAAVSNEMAEATAIAGTPDQVRRQLDKYNGLIDLPVLYSPSFGLSADRVAENCKSIIETFGR
jgi:probable F420-dependent oxidoreductase